MPDSHDIQVGVGGLVLRADKVLLVKMTYGPSKGRWIHPGGYLEPSEALAEAARREVREVTGVLAQPTRIVATRSRVSAEETHDLFIAFAMTYESGEPQPDGHEVEAAEFWSLEQVLTSPEVMPFTQTLVRLMQQGGGLAPVDYTPTVGGYHHYQLFGIHS